MAEGRSDYAAEIAAALTTLAREIEDVARVETIATPAVATETLAKLAQQQEEQMRQLKSGHEQQLQRLLQQQERVRMPVPARQAQERQFIQQHANQQQEFAESLRQQRENLRAVLDGRGRASSAPSA